MDTALVSDKVSMVAHVHVRIVVVVAVVVVAVSAEVYFLFSGRSVVCMLARGAAIRAGTCGFVCICKHVCLQELPGIVPWFHCRGRWTILQDG